MFGPESTADEVLAGIDLTDTTALVTGASSGLGLETVRALVSHGAKVVATARDRNKAERAFAEAGITSEGAVSLELIDLADLSSVRSGSARIGATYDHLDLLIANAGVMACPFGLTVDGFEMQFGTNHLGHFVLVNRLVPLLLARSPSRVVCLSSTAHRGSDVDLDDPNFESTEYQSFKAYGRSKTANVLFAVELDRRLAHRGVRACALHPGGIDTELFRHLDAETLEQINAHRQAPKSIPSGAATTVWAAVVADADEIGGRYAEDCAVSEVCDTAARAGVRSYALDPERARALWALSEEMVGEHFPE